MTTLTDFLLARIAEEENAARIAETQPHAAMNITRWHPAHVLADCNARRRIVAMHGELCFGNGDPAGDEVLEVLAQPYADHPDYDPPWNA